MLWAALDHLWQSTLVVAIIVVAVPLFRRQAARTRFWLWFAASAKFLLPFALLTALGTQLAAQFKPATLPATLAGFLDAPAGKIAAVSLAPLSAAQPPVTPTIPSGFDWSLLIGAIWLAGTVAFTLRWIINSLGVRAMVRAATPSTIPAPLPVRITDAPIQPALAGLVHPCILLPRKALADLSPGEQEAILAHEISHWQRRDHLWSLVHRLVEFLFWFHPLVWWLGARLNEERERACDESVLQSGFAAPDYAASLVRVCGLHLRATPLAGAQMSAANLKARIGNILAQSPPLPFGNGHRAAIAAALLACLAMPVCLGFARSPTTADPDIIHTTMHPPSEAVLRRAIAQLETRPSSSAVSKTVAVAAPALQFRIHRHLMTWGALQSLSFSHTDAQGDDQYEGVFAGGRAYFVVHLTPDGQSLEKLDFHVMVDRNPIARSHPGTRDAVRNYIMAIQKGAPDYAGMTADFASAVFRTKPVAFHYLNRWGAFDSITFLDQDDNGMDVYRVHFAHAWSDWRIAPLHDGKIWAMNFWGVSTGPGSSRQVRK